MAVAARRSRTPRHRALAAVYDQLFAANEKAGLRDLRADLLGSASGRTIEIGAGTGLNLEHYRPAVTELVLAEPDPYMARRLRRRIKENPPAVESVEVVEAGAERLPFESATFDTAVSTLVLCTVPEPQTAVAEVRRVLKQGGRFIYAEHVRDEDGTKRARWQDRLETPWGWLLGGCHPNRDTGSLIADAFDTSRPQPGKFPGDDPVTAVVKPLISGELRR